MRQSYSIVLVGGSAGSLPVLISLLQGLPKGFNIPLVIITHRQKNVQSSLDTILSGYSPYCTITEPEDKEPLVPGHIYLAPQNYHLLIESDHTFSLDYSEPVLFSRPAIDVTFESAAAVYTNKALAIVLSGANSDGAAGLQTIMQYGGAGIVQDPESALYKAMPQAALVQNPLTHKLMPDNIVSFVANLIM